VLAAPLPTGRGTDSTPLPYGHLEFDLAVGSRHANSLGGQRWMRQALFDNRVILISIAGEVSPNLRIFTQLIDKV